jgi:hypothetical protein
LNKAQRLEELEIVDNTLRALIEQHGSSNHAAHLARTGSGLNQKTHRTGALTIN